MIFWIFVAMTALFGWFTWIAISTDSGVVTTNAYQYGLEYNDIIAKQSESDALPWQMTLERAEVKNGKTSLVITIQNPTNGKTNFDAVRAWLIRPAHSGRDFELQLQPHGVNRYRAEFDLPEIGLWELQVTAKSGNDQKQWQRDLQWR